MKGKFYPRIAWTGIKKNKQMYLPYLLTCMGMIMMYYIVAFLNASSLLDNIRGGATVQTMLGLGGWVISIFALIFLFYTNSFLIRRRKKEFGLYNILGMGKWNLARVLLWESLMTFGISMAGGLLGGIVFSKFAELGMMNLLKQEVTFNLEAEPKVIGHTAARFAVIFFLLLLNTLRQIQLSNPIELLRSENAGEKPPKANWVLALAGVVILAAAYYIAVSIEDPVAALLWFFIAVILVIIATYLLFIAGSVAICRILQKNKTYYYKTNHFVSVSSMVYRMKRNGAGLASICILCTMVLVMISATACMYIGSEDSFRKRYPRHISLQATVEGLEILNSDKTAEVKEICETAAQEKGQEPVNVQDYSMAGFTVYLNGDQFFTDLTMSDFQYGMFTDVWQVFLVPLSDYNRLAEADETLETGEALLYTTKSDYDYETVTLPVGETLQIKKTVPEFWDNSIDTMQVIPTMYLVVPDLETCVEPMLPLQYESGNSMVKLYWFYGYDLDCTDEVQEQVWEQIEEELQDVELNVSCESAARKRGEYYGLFGGLFFLGILLGIVFVFAAVLIMYYKQVSEGYEDQGRFEIMQKVGMTKKEIKKSINSQILTVFFLPLLAAGVHLAFAFPMISKMMPLLGLTDMKLLAMVTVGCYLTFAVCYVWVYRITSRAYYRIVSGPAR
ncbi:MAG: FtsX-like permease family protein [Eubacteriales bacterium]|nr:FtsX-like permease family protein [Eubacteriales bacterium]